jgi:hypothetical protein
MIERHPRLISVLLILMVPLVVGLVGGAVEPLLAALIVGPFLIVAALFLDRPI